MKYVEAVNNQNNTKNLTKPAENLLMKAKREGFQPRDNLYLHLLELALHYMFCQVELVRFKEGLGYEK